MHVLNIVTIVNLDIKVSKTLGVTFHNNPTKNLEPNRIDFSKCLKQWRHRKLTVMVKLTVIKTFALLKIVYPFTVVKTLTIQMLG